MNFDKLTFEQALKDCGEVGTIVEARYPIISVDGLPQVKQHELIICETGELGEVFELNSTKVQVALFTNDQPRIGTRVTRLNNQMILSIHDGFFNAVYNPLGNLLLGKSKKVSTVIERNVFKSDNSLKNFRAVKQQCVTGVNVVDMVVPIGKGQRQLLVGDRKTGKRALALQIAGAAVAQGMFVVYAIIGQNANIVQYTYEQLKNENASENTAIIATTSADSPMLIYLTPYSAMAIAESLQERGHDVLIIFDDLTTHAQVYRELSLLSGRFPGRESYPGDIFYIHANLLERAGNFLNAEGNEASITALPIIHTNDGEIASYITTNSIGMTDGHLYFDKELFLKGIRPPIHMGLSVTRAGKQTQSPLLRDINSTVGSFYAQYNRLQNYARFGGEMSESVKETLFQGELLTKFFTWANSAASTIQIEIIIFTLIWLGYFKRENINAMYSVRKNLTYAYNQPEGKAFISGLSQAKTLKEIEEQITKVEVTLLKLCGLKK
jgi:F-type H+/Na+-transporting ATPase subunit alpha